MQDFEAEALGILAKASQGYPYFIQELGCAMRRLAEGFPFTAHDVRRTELPVGDGIRRPSALDDFFHC